MNEDRMDFQEFADVIQKISEKQGWNPARLPL